MTNIHKRDELITFDADTHTYCIDSVPCFTSATGLVSRLFPKFDSMKTIDQYYDRWQQNRHPRYSGKTKAAILEEWEEDGRVGSTLGTRLHEAVESFYKGETPYIKEVESDFQLFLDFYKDHSHLKPYRMEWRVGTNPDIGIAGTIDMCFTDDTFSNNELIVADWKRTKKGITTVGFKNRMGIGPLSHLPDTNFYHYSIQLNIYKYILENYYGLQVRDMFFVAIHHIHQQYIKCPVENLQYEIADIFQRIKQHRVHNLK